MPTAYGIEYSKEVTTEIVDEVLDEVICINTPFFQETIERFTTAQRNLIKAVIAGELQMTSVRVMAQYRLGTSNNVRHNLSVLVDNDIVDKLKGDYELLDPVFELWFKRKFCY